MPLLGQHHRDPHDSELEGAERIASKVETLQERVKKLFLTFGAMTDEELLEAYVANYELHGRAAGVFRARAARH